MSDTRSTVTDRTSSILNRDHPPDKRPKSDKLPGTPTHEFDPTDVLVQKSGFVVADRRPESCGLVQRCVIIQKDENGFGLTVSGDNPVFVQLVKQDGAAMRAGVQTGDRIIKVNGTLVTQSNHVEVVNLIKSGSYVALTLLGRPPGSPQIPLSEVNVGLGSPGCFGDPFVTSPNSYNAAARTSSPLVPWEENSASHNQRIDIKRMVSKEQQDMQGLMEDYSRTHTAKPLRDIQEAKKHIPHQQGQLNRATHEGMCLRNSEDGCWVDEDQYKGDFSPEGFWSGSSVQHRFYLASPESRRASNCSSPKSTPRDSLNSCPSPEVEDRSDLDSRFQSSIGSPPSRLATEIIAAEDDDFDTEQEQVNGQCSCFQNIELLKTRPAHLAAFLHHVISQFDPAPLLCYLYADLYKQTNSKEMRRIFMDFLTFFIDRGANLKVAVPESISTELERRRPELIPEELHRQYIQTMQETLLPDVHRNLEDFRQKRSMGLTLADVELSRLDSEQLALERERSCAENILSKIDDILLTSQPTEEEKCTTIQYVIFMYMKHLGVRVKEQRNLESKRVRINFLPSKLRKSKTEKEGEEKLKKPRFPIRVPPRWPSRIDSLPSGRAGDNIKQRPQKQMSQPAMGGSDLIESGRMRGSQSSEGSDLLQSPGLITSPPFSAPYGSPTDPSGRDPEFNSPSAVVPRLSDGVQSGDVLDSIYPPCDYIPYNMDQLDEDRDGDRLHDVGTPKLSRRFEELQSEDDQGSDVYSDVDPPNWQQLVGRDVLAGLTPHEIKRQEVINELFYTERAHVRMLKVLDSVFYQKLTRENILPLADIKNIFTNLEEIIQLHMRIADQMTAIRKKNETSVIDHIGDELLSWFSGGEEEKIMQAVGTFCSNQPFALELIKSRQKKDQRFTSFMQEAESNRLCRRLQLKDIIPAEMQRFTKYPLLMDNIAKYTDESEEKVKVRRAAEYCRQILNHVNQSVKESENKQRLEDYQRRLDLSSLKQSENPMISEFKNLDLTKRKMVHEGPLSWKINKDKTIELYTLLLEDILVLLQKQDERLILRCQSKNLAGTADTKHIFSPIIKLSTVLVRSVATDNRSFFVISMSKNGAQIYELMAQTVSEQRMWQGQIAQRAEVKNAKPHSVIPLPQHDGDRDGVELSKFSKGSERISTGSIQSAEKDSEFSPSAALRDCVPDANPGEEDQVPRAGKDGSYLDSVLLNGRDADSLSCSSKADEALKTLAALKQVLVTQLMAQDEGERLGRSAGSRLLRTTSLRTPVEHSSARSPSRAQDYTSGDTGFYECPEDYAAYLVLEGYGGSGESSTDDDIQVGRKEPSLAHSCAADSGISLKFSSPSSGSTSRLSRQVLSHLRCLQANLNHLKEMETKYYNLLRQRPVGSAADADESRDKK
ncbi:rho guanine nucleotide exchange factor 12 isoform X1 [Rhinichthys klamathensis goyatoka]|uniref:rho guanine nucleotide exchange factor 12 isoform X1 n=1 Tax=Rhinichthys klamathensis goyatoka TaxID=3034132 RepID=UPI0024B56A39|nr:rho guanine nucleotide exchange factor 12 isoform X1 [Rhinichthys klamathensis goyatoka]